MTELTDAQYQMLKDYNELLTGMHEGLIYLEQNLIEEVPPQVDQVFNDLLAGFEQLHKAHSQMLVIFTDNGEITELVEECKQIIEQLTKWFTFDSNLAKQQLLTNQVVPAFDSWKNNMEQFLKPYIVH
ncbi:hypothetical protein [Aquibacillus rhizosphaerae]|uniref:DUF8042 domain-containing protein n=1 Tax=Aquibacillus rhizosphaerae TaxID=3051431 RepID=A0ABT7L092_9BACI|nr:hypothetical protein [Aquibacillus sp. LR5S19]MDL4839231.1 hypothetical protein [Aquibacillus sp. LR5S19]